MDTLWPKYFADSDQHCIEGLCPKCTVMEGHYSSVQFNNINMFCVVMNVYIPKSLFVCVHEEYAAVCVVYYVFQAHYLSQFIKQLMDNMQLIARVCVCVGVCGFVFYK